MPTYHIPADHMTSWYTNAINAGVIQLLLNWNMVESNFTFHRRNQIEFNIAWIFYVYMRRKRDVDSSKFIRISIKNINITTKISQTKKKDKNLKRISLNWFEFGNKNHVNNEFIRFELSKFSTLNQISTFNFIWLFSATIQFHIISEESWSLHYALHFPW